MIETLRTPSLYTHHAKIQYYETCAKCNKEHTNSSIYIVKYKDKARVLCKACYDELRGAK